MRGAIAKEARKSRAKERLKKHLSDHRINHKDEIGEDKRFNEETFVKHDKIQKSELEKL